MAKQKKKTDTYQLQTDILSGVKVDIPSLPLPNGKVKLNCVLGFIFRY